MQPLVPFLISAVVVYVSCTPGHAQLIQIRPGFVKAPFVQVHKYADGSSYVRAPFVSVHSPGQQRLHPSHLTAGGDPAQMNWAALGTALCQSADQLDAQLRQFPTGAYWSTHLGTAEIRSLLGRDFDGPPHEDARQRLQHIVQAYDGVHDTPELSAIVGLSGFQSVHVLLHELLMPAELRLRRELVTAAAHLNRSLSRLNDGAQWRDYLALGFAFAQEDAHRVVPSRDDVAKVLRRYDSIRDDDEIARLPSFRATHELLRAYWQLLDDQSASPSSSVEDLPPPVPAAAEVQLPRAEIE